MIETAFGGEIIGGRTGSTVGTVLMGEGEANSDRWIKPAEWVARRTLDVSAVRDRLVAENRWLVESMSIDYGKDCGLCGDLWERQAEFASWALARRGVHDKKQFKTRDQECVLAGPRSVYHVDEGFGTPTAMFVVTSVLGGGVLHFPELGLELSFEAGQTVMFDELQVHGLKAESGGAVGGQAFVVVSSQVLVNEAGAQVLGLVCPWDGKSGVDLADAVVDQSTGGVVGRRSSCARPHGGATKAIHLVDLTRNQ